jgi:hypothetical protein
MAENDWRGVKAEGHRIPPWKNAYLQAISCSRIACGIFSRCLNNEFFEDFVSPSERDIYSVKKSIRMASMIMKKM